MHQRALEILKPLDIGPAPAVELALSHDQDICSDELRPARELVMHLYQPLPNAVMPPSLADFASETKVLVDAVLGRDSSPVTQDLRASGVIV